MHVATTIAQVRAHRRAAAGVVALVPTMGAFHDGHLAHVHRCRQIADHIFVSIFVNPTQFGPDEHFDRYPRSMEEDLAHCRRAGASCVFIPEVDQMYPADGIETLVEVPPLSRDLEATARPGHFRGVCRVVLKLLHIIQPACVTFGYKDYQQLRIIEALLSDLALDVRLEPIDTVRDPDGLAMSSRNQTLSPLDRPKALGLYKSLQQARMMIEDAGQTDPRVVQQEMHSILSTHGFAVDYAVVRHPMTLAKVAKIDPAHTNSVVALAAGSLGGVRLIDNLRIGLR